jgi:tetratricopeptide (TPR) repeat protein
MTDFKSEKNQFLLLEKYYIDRNFSEALVLAGKLLQQYPTSFPLKLLHARVLKAMGRLTEAERFLVELGKNYPDNINLLSEIGDLYAKQKKFAESLAYFNRILFLDSFNEQARAGVRTAQDSIRNRDVENFEDTLLEVRVPEKLFQKSEPTVPPPAAPGVNPDEPAVRVEPAPDITIQLDEETAENTSPAAGLPLEEPPLGAEPAKEGPGQDEFDFETETAAELYLRQGIPREALRIYRKLYEQTGDANFLERIGEIENQDKGDRENETIDRLNRFLQLIRKRGNELV